MAIIKCTECGKDISDRAAACVHCGCPIEKEVVTKPKIIASGKVDLTEDSAVRIIKNANNEAIAVSQLYERYGISIQEAKDVVNQICVDRGIVFTTRGAKEKSEAGCPKCGSTSLSGNKKGFGVGKAVVGAALTGGIGLLAGNMGAKKVRVTCLKCGHQWWAGK